MFNLEKTERAIIIFLSLTLILGLAIMAYNKYRPSANLKIEKFGPHNEPVKQEININEAGTDELMALKGIGHTLAQRIIDYRDQYGRFSSVSDIKRVRGVGKTLFEKIKDDITAE